MKESPEWLLLIKHWVKDGIHYGYTFPFLMGARAIQKGITKITPKDARQLIEEIFNPPVSGDVVQIILFPELGVPVFGLYKEPIPGKQFKSSITGLPSVFVRQDLLDKWGDSVEAVISNILNESEKPIQEGLFSRTLDKKWTPFSDMEIENINRLLDIE
jgi:hypothetical protein